ncbi:hypothetical protein IWX46DRAFT_600291 [Phyllosticta citricarpa]|uniref:Apple domain-containing protein n=2 Tax=Phyllosticta TaxID=121621 RepID=A0ABR1MDE1_9PEZI
MKNSVFALSALAGIAMSSPLAARDNGITVDPAWLAAPSLKADPTAIYAQAAAASAASNLVATPVTTLKKRNYWYVNCASTTVATTITSVLTSASATITSVIATSSVVTVPTTTAPIITCSVRPTGAGVVPTPDTDTAFLADQEFHDDANKAPLTVPGQSGIYTQTFKDLQGATEMNTYMGYKTLDSYDVAGCAAFCDNTKLCQSFNIYVERDPLYEQNDASCSNASTIYFKCSLYGSYIDGKSATNVGQYQGSFHVVISGSNGYSMPNATATKPPTCNQPGSNTWGSGKPCNGGGIIKKPGNCMGSKFFPGPFDPMVCSAYASAQVALNRKTGNWWNPSSWLPCSSFNAYTVKRNGVAIGMQCVLFYNAVSPSTDVVPFNPSSGSDSYTCESSLVYTVTNGWFTWLNSFF